jgi:hypothetical protein
VGRVIEEVGLSDLNEKLVGRRTGEHGEPASFRDLVDHFNREVLRSALLDAGEAPLEGEVENMYRLLTDDEVSKGTQLRIRKQLDRDGVDLDAVEQRFVSHPTMGSHLQDCLGVEKSRSSQDRLEAAKERIFKMQSRTEAVIENTLEGLASAGQIATGAPVVTLHVRVTCEDCGVHAPVRGFIDGDGCDCDTDR